MSLRPGRAQNQVVLDRDTNLSDTPASTNVEATLDKIKDEAENLLLHFDFLDAWQKDNYYITTGYRRTSYSYRKSLKSILSLHNESVNIWTHLVPGIIVASLLVGLLGNYCFNPRHREDLTAFRYGHYASAGSKDALVLLIFLGGACSMFSASWFYHAGEFN